MGLEFEIRPANIDEKAVRHSDFRHLPEVVARAKSEELKKHIHEPSILITADSVVIFDGELREKPRNEDEARRFLQSLGNKPVEVVSGVVVCNTHNSKTVSGTESAKIYFHKLPHAFIEELIHHGHILDRAGAFDVDLLPMKKYIIHIDGSLDAAMGLPKALTKKLIDEVKL